MIGISKNGLWNYENNKRSISVELLQEIAKKLKVPINKLIYVPTKEAFLNDLISEQRYTMGILSDAIGIDKESIEEYFLNPFVENKNLHFAIGKFLMFTEDDLKERIELDKLFFDEADKTQIEYYKNAVDYEYDIFKSRSIKEDKGFDIDPELIKQAREMFASFYPTSKQRPADSLEEEEQQVLEKFRLLNDLGQQEGIKRIDELSQIDKYKKRSVDLAQNEDKPDNQE